MNNENKASGNRPEGGEDQHYYGGQAVIEGVMMRGKDKYAVAVRREDDQIILGEKPLDGFAERHKWAKLALIRGNVAIVESVVLGMGALYFSADVLAQEDQERIAAEARQVEADQHAGDHRDRPADTAEYSPDDAPHQQDEAQPPNGDTSTEPDQDPPDSQASGLGTLAKWGTMAFSFAFAIGVFLLLPTWAVDWFLGGIPENAPYWDQVVRNAIEGGIRLALLMLYVVAISFMPYVRRLFQYHGAEHATINCFEAGDEVIAENCAKYSPLHPRCGTAFLFVVILLKIVLGWFFGWPVLWLRMLIRIGLLPIVAGLGYEVIRWAGRHRGSVLARMLAAPGMLMQMLTTRQPDVEQTKVAIYSLAAVAPEVSLPEGYAPARRVNIPLKPESQTAEPDAEPSAEPEASPRRQ